MKAYFLIILISSLIFQACLNKDTGGNVEVSLSDQLYTQAANLDSDQSCDSVLVLLQHAFTQGLENPMRIITDSNFYELVDQPECRSKVRELLKIHAVEHEATMVRENEAGEMISVRGKILDESDGSPLEKVLVEIVHTDSMGLYFPERSLFNPRLFAYLITNNQGQFSVQSIRPGSYQDDKGNPVPAHMHFTLEKEGYRTYGSEFTFEDDPIFKANGNVDSVPVAIKDKDNPSHYSVEIRLQKIR